MFTIVTDESKDEKLLCLGSAYMALAAVVDYEFTLAKPFRLTADTGIDAMCHAMEAYVSRKANGLRIHVYDVGQHTRRHGITNSSVTLIHGVSRCIGATFSCAARALECDARTSGDEVLYSRCCRSLCSCGTSS